MANTETNIINNSLVLSNKEHDVVVEVGDTKQELFYPQVKVTKWDNEANFSIRLIDDDQAVQTFQREDNYIVWNNGKNRARFYERHIDLEQEAFEDALEYPDNSGKITYSEEHFPHLRDGDYIWGRDDEYEREIRCNAAQEMYGNVLVVGLGLGVINEYLITNTNVESITIVESSQDVINIVNRHYPERLNNIKVIADDYWKYVETTNDTYDCVYGDIFTDLRPQYLHLWKRFVEKTQRISNNINGRMKEAYDAFVARHQKIQDNSLEFDIVIDKKPKDNIISFSLQHKNVEFIYQPKLSDKEIKGGKYRSPSVVGSYAVYHKEKSGDFTALGGKNYMAGKVGHIFRPLIFDSANNKIYGDIVIIDNKLDVIIPQEFLDKAIYPIIVDPTFGYTTIGGTATASYGYDVMQGSLFTGAAGKGVAITAYVTNNSSVSMKGGIYTHSTLNLLTNGTTEETTAPIASSWVMLGFSTFPTLTATDYVVMMYRTSVGKGGSNVMYYDTGSADQGHSESTTSITYPTFPNPVSVSHNTNKYSVYVTYNANDIESNTYYFDGNDGISDPNNAWSTDANAFDGSTSTSAFTGYSGVYPTTHYLQGAGTTAPTSGGTIVEVHARVYSGEWMSYVWSDWLKLSTPSGGWTWTKVNGLTLRAWQEFFASPYNNYQIAVRIYEQGDAGGTVLGEVFGVGNYDNGELFKVELRVISEVSSSTTYQNTVSANSRIKTTARKTVSANASIKTAQRKTITSNSRLQNTQQKTVSADIPLAYSLHYIDDLFTFTDSYIYSLNNGSAKYSMRFTYSGTGSPVTQMGFYSWNGAAGTAPTYRVGLQADDGSGNPTGTWLGATNSGYADFSPGNIQGSFGVTLVETVTLTSGTDYHIVIQHQSGTIDGSNYRRMLLHTIDTTYTNAPPKFLPSDFYDKQNYKVLVNWGSAWETLHESGAPIFYLQSSDASKFGQPHYKSDYYSIRGSIMYGTFWQNLLGNFISDKVGVYVKKFGSPADDLEYELAEMSPLGTSVTTSIETGTVATAANVGTDPKWIYVTLSSPRLFEYGKRYALILKSPSSADDSNCYAATTLRFLSTSQTTSIPGDLTYSSDSGSTYTLYSGYKPNVRYNVQSIQRYTFANALITTGDIKQTILTNASIKNTQQQNVLTNTNIIDPVVHKPILVSPADTSTSYATTTFVWEIPAAPDNSNVHSHIQIGDITFSSYVEHYSWHGNMEYWNGSSWVAYPADGVTSTYYGNQARITISGLTPTETYYWRVRGLK